MAKVIKKVPSSKLHTREIARSWLQQGILTVPLVSRSKKPAGGFGWNKLRITEDTIDQFFQDGQNIGGLWGDPSDGIIDVDLDWDEACQVAPLLLPETFVYGRASRPVSHFLFRCPGMESLKCRSIENQTIIEVRSTGSQSVLPPSIHPDGDRYQIFSEAPIASISRKQLTLSVQRIAAASVFIKYYPGEGGRHDYIHAITGALMYGGWNEDDTTRFMVALLTACSGKEEDLSDRKYTVRNTIQHYKRGDRVYGWNTLSQWMPGPAMDLIRRWLIKSVPVDVVPGIVRVAGAKTPSLFETHPDLLEVPGLVGDILHWASERAYIKQPGFNLAVGLACTALATCNKYVVDNWETPLQPYFMLVAPTAAGKESALDSVYGFCRKIGLGEYVFQGFQSYHSLLDTMAETPHMACWCWDEAARKLRSAARSPSSPENQVITWLLSLYGRANSYSPAVPGRHNKISAVDFPFLSVMAASQPAQLMEALTEAEISTGMVNRFVLFDAGDKIPEPNLERKLIFPSSIEDKVTALKHIEPPKTDYPFIRIRFENQQVWNLFRDFESEARGYAFQEGSGEMWGRANQNALILAGIVSVGINPKKPFISTETAEWAMKIVRWSCTTWMTRIDESASRSIVEKRSKLVEKIIRQAKWHIDKVKGKKQKALVERGFMPKALLVRLCRHITTKDLDDVVNQLMVSDILATGDIEGVEVYWLKD